MIDTHQHLLFTDRFNYPWTAAIPGLQRGFDLSDYQRASHGHAITGTIAMEADVAGDQSPAEAAYLCGLAEDPATGILAVVAAARPEHPDFEAQLDRIAHPRLKGIRRILHTSADDLSATRLFRDHLALLGKRGLTFDICVQARQLPVALELVRSSPDTRFILDHCGNPGIAANDFTAWRTALQPLAACDNLCCKISGLPVHCPAGQVDAATLSPYLFEVLELFGWERVVWGGDWPVCNLNGGLGVWIDACLHALAGEDGEEVRMRFERNARRIYQL